MTAPDLAPRVSNTQSQKTTGRQTASRANTLQATAQDQQPQSPDQLQKIINDSETYLYETQQTQEQDYGTINTRAPHSPNNFGSLHQRSMVGENTLLGGKDATKSSTYLWDKLSGKEWDTLTQLQSDQKELEAQLDRDSIAVEQNLKEQNISEVEMEQLKVKVNALRQEGVRLVQDRDATVAKFTEAKLKGSQKLDQILCQES